MSTLTAIMEELAATLEDALDDSVQQVAPRLVPNPTTPSVDIFPANPFRESDTTAAFQEVSGAYIFTVRARVNLADDIAAQDVLLNMMDDQSDECVAAILMDDQSLNGLASSVDVDGPTGFLPFDDVAGNLLIGCTWTVTVLNVVT